MATSLELSASVVAVLVVYLLYKNRRALRLKHRKISTASTTSQDNLPEYSLAGHKAICPGTPTVLSFPSPTAHEQHAVPLILRTVNSIEQNSEEAADFSNSPKQSVDDIPDIRKGHEDDDANSSSSESSSSSDHPLSGTSKSGSRRGKNGSNDYMLRRTKTYDKYTTAWFSTSSEEQAKSPPSDLSAHPELKNGDLFIHKCPKATQAWMWEAGKHEWKSIIEGYMRADGRRFTLTAKRGQPSWVSGEWATRRIREKKE